MDICLNFKGGGSFVNFKPVFSSTGESIFVSSKNTISEYNVKTGNLIYKYQGTQQDILGFTCNMIDNFECLTACSKTGQLIIWKAGSNKIKIFEKSLEQKVIKSFHLLSDSLEQGLKTLVSSKGKTGIHFSIINMKSDEKRILPKIRLEVADFAVDVSGNEYFAVTQNNLVYFVNLKTLKYSQYQMSQENRTFTCVTCHPTDEIVMTGDSSGRIVVWQNIFMKNKSQAVFHWHTLPVNCLAFSTLGSYFYSGANECVLVKWQFDNAENKAFHPRLPAGIKHVVVSPNSALIAITTADSAIRILDTSMRQVTVIQHLVLGNQLECGMAYDPITRALVMNGNVGCLQFYSPEDMSLLYNIDIVNQNKITAERDCVIDNTEIRKIALSKNSTWLATVEERREKDLCCEIRLKFWMFNAEKQTYELNTSIEYPHEKSIDSIAFQPLVKKDQLKCITVGNDKKFKIWQVVEVATVYKTGPVWRCFSIGSYRALDCKGLAFSIDGSLFAIGFDVILTVWTPDTCSFKCSLVHPDHKNKIRDIKFGQGNQCHLLVAAGQSQISVWNILTLTLVWVVPLKRISLLVADSLSTNMVVITKTNEVYVFEPASPKPLFASKDLLNQKELIVAATFVPSKYSNDNRLPWSERSNLYVATSNNELYSINKNKELFEYNSLTEDSEDTSVFTRLLPTSKISKVKNNNSKQLLFERDIGHKNIREYLDAPLQTLPPIRFMCASLLKPLVLQTENAGFKAVIEYSMACTPKNHQSHEKQKQRQREAMRKLGLRLGLEISVVFIFFSLSL